MAQRRRRRSKKWIGWLWFLLLVGVAVVICYLVWDAYFRDKIDTEVEETEVTQVVAEKKEDKTETEGAKEEVSEKEKVVQYDGDDPNAAQELTGVVTYAGVSGENLMIRVNIDQYLDGGTCTLGLRREGMNLYSAEAAIVDAVSTSTCEGFNVPMAGLGSGKTAIWIFLSSGEKTGEIYGEVEL